MFTILIFSFLTAGVLSSPADKISKDGRIIGGSEAAPGQFPFQAALLAGEDDEFQCGCSIVNNRWVVTAAHCIRGMSPFSFSILAGTNDLKGEGYRYGVSKFVRHEGDDPKTKQHDIGLIKTITEIIFNEFVQAIPLNTEELSPQTDVVIAGWGYTSWPGTIQDKLRFLPTKIMRRIDCALSLIWDYPVTDDQLCTFTRRGEGMCGGDSGSAVVYNGKLAGAVSWGIPCGRGSPDVHTNISAHYDWIQKNTQ